MYSASGSISLTSVIAQLTISKALTLPDIATVRAYQTPRPSCQTF